MNMKHRYLNIAGQAVYENSRDCIYYGYSFSYLNKCGLDEQEARKIWNQALEDMASNY